MGPNALWLVEWLCERLAISPGMKVLDLGCGRAMSSVFLAKEFGAQVWAIDLWMDPDHNWRRVVESGVGDRVCLRAPERPYRTGSRSERSSIPSLRNRSLRSAGWIRTERIV